MAQATTERTRARDPIGDTFDVGDQGVGEGMGMTAYGGAGGMPSILPAHQGDTSLNILAGNITAQRVVVPRNIEKVRRELSALAAMAGKEWVWGWFVKKKQKGGAYKQEWIEGPTIKLANDLARTWGNCDIRPMVVDEGTHWMFYARFVDLETGYTLIRAFQQRKGQNTGMQDNARALDMIFQLGQSKAIRNVIVNALQTIATFCVEEANNSEVEKIRKDPEKARQILLRKLDQNSVDLKRVEKVYGRTANNWTAENMAKIMSEVMAFIDGMGDQEDIWRLSEDDQDAGAGETAMPKGETNTPTADTNAGAGKTGTAAAQEQELATGGAAPHDEQTGRPASAAATEQSDGELTRVVVLPGGVRIGTLPATTDVKVGVEYEMFGGIVKVLEFNDREIVVEKVVREPAKQQAAKTTAAPKKPAGGKAKLFGPED